MAEAASLQQGAENLASAVPLCKDLELTQEHLTDLVTLLHTASPKWEIIATFLGVDNVTIESIGSAQDRDMNLKLLNVVKRWLKTKLPTVKALIEVLNNPVIGEQKLAVDVENHFHSQLASPLASHTSLQKSLSSDTQMHVAQHSAKIDRSKSSPAAVFVESTLPKATLKSVDGCEAPVPVKTPVDDPEIEHTSVPVKTPVDNEHTSVPVKTSVDNPDVEHTSAYKFLKLEIMSELERKTLLGRLTNDYKRITASYSELNQYVIQSLRDRSVTPKMLSTVLMNLSAFRVQTDMEDKSSHTPLLADHLDSIREADDIDDVFYILRPYGSVFDCHIIRHIVNSRLCSDEDKEELQKYEDKLKDYCRRSVFECPHIENKDPKFRHFVMKVDDSVFKSSIMKAIDAFRVEVAEVCGLEGHTLSLCTVEDGCLQFVFQIPPCVADSLFPLTYEQKVALKGLGVLKLTNELPPVDYNFQSHKLLPCAWRRLFGRCNYNEQDCRYDHNVEPVQEPSVGDLLDSEFVTASAVKKIPPSGHGSSGKPYVLLFNETEANLEIKLVAEDKDTLDFAQEEVKNQLQLLREDTRLKYSYLHPDGIELPVLYAFKKRGNTKFVQLEQIKPKGPVKQMTVEDFDHLPAKHVTPAYSRLNRHKRNVYPMQLRQDYKEDILKQLKQGLCWMHENHLTPQIEGRFGKFTWRNSLDDECFTVEKLIALSKEPTGLRYYTFSTEVSSDDIIALKSGRRQIGHQEKTYTLTLVDKQGGDVGYRVKIKFDDNQKPSIIYIRKLVKTGDFSAPKVRVLLDILFLHRNYDVRVSLSNFDTVEDPSVLQFIASTIEMPQPGVLHYNPVLCQEKWSVNYIRSQESESFELHDSYIVEISAVGEYSIGRPELNTECTIRKEDFRRKHELELQCKSPTLNPNLILRDINWDIAEPSVARWTPDEIIEDFLKTGFLEMIEDLNVTLSEPR